jgi:hypothetical protein
MNKVVKHSVGRTENPQPLDLPNVQRQYQEIYHDLCDWIGN